jgi:tetraprenyl-beta-curcumene synthase
MNVLTFVGVSIIAPPELVINTKFVSAGIRYWMGVFPLVCCEIQRLEQRARTIPDPGLRRVALKALKDERGNLEGATAYAAFTPRPYRAAVARATMTFQAAYDYADALSEQPDAGHDGNVCRLHQALAIALKPGACHLDYYAFHIQKDDGGYLDSLVDRCRSALCLLPSFSAVAASARRAATRIVTYQRLNNPGKNESYHPFARWAKGIVAPEADLRWWEAGASAGSSLAVFAVMSAAAGPRLSADYVTALECEYFPWIGSLHTLLESLIDEHEDAITGQHCLTARYTSREETANRLQRLAARADDHAKALCDGEHHMMILAAMVSFYLASPRAKSPHARLVAEQVLTTLGAHALPAMAVLGARHAVGRLLRRGS